MLGVYVVLSALSAALPSRPDRPPVVFWHRCICQIRSAHLWLGSGRTSHYDLSQLPAAPTASCGTAAKAWKADDMDHRTTRRWPIRDIRSFSVFGWS